MVTHWVSISCGYIARTRSRSSRSGCVRGTLSVFEVAGHRWGPSSGVFSLCLCIASTCWILSHWGFPLLGVKGSLPVGGASSDWPAGFCPSASMKSWLRNPLSELPWPLEAPCVMCFKVNRGLAELPSLQWEAKWPLLDFTVRALYLKREEKKPGELKTRAGGDG